MRPIKMLRGYHKPESGRHTEIAAGGHRSEARSSVAERCRYMAEEGVRILPRLPGRPVERVNKRGVTVNSLLRASSMVALAIAALSVAACSSGGAPAAVSTPLTRTPDNMSPGDTAPMDQYVIGSGDSLSIFVYRNPDLSEGGVSVRPDGRISTPLIEDITAAGKTPTQLARELEGRLKKYIQDPNVTVIVRSFIGPFDRQIRVIGEATEPAAIPYRDHMTLLDVMIATKGLTKYAAGNRAEIVRRDVDGKQTAIRVRLNDLIKDGDIDQNIEMQPGDTLIIPQTWF
jgi:polysaccharide export outer membrane protein